MGKSGASPPPIQPVILSGGTGSRLWPLSRALTPKQLLPLASDRTMLQETVGRVGDPARYAPPLVVCNDEHRFLVAEQLREIAGPTPLIVVEPEGRNTAPAAAAAALLLSARAPETLLLVLASDHVIADEAAFHAGVDRAARAARGGYLVTFGIAPEHPETGYGYIKSGEALDGAPGCHRVARFVEKPAAEAAASMLAEGGWAWNSGMFLFSAQSYLDELARLEPDMLAACRAAVDGGGADPDFVRLNAEAFAAAPARSIDHAVMEHTELAAVVPVDIGWNDVGSWASLWDIGDKDADGNVRLGEVLSEDSRGCYLRGDGRPVAAVGLRDLVVVATDDAVLVADRGRAQGVRQVVERLKAEGSPHYLAHPKVVRPWGYYRSLESGAGFQVKEIVVNPGAKLSLQKHHHRAEHWVVVDGTARVTLDAETFERGPDETTYIPREAVHRVENPGAEPLRLIEVQCGDYLGEDDIVRLEDDYGRIPSG